MNVRPLVFLLAMLASASVAVEDGNAADERRSAIKGVVDEAVRPVMHRHDIPGMAVAIVTRDGSLVFNYGVASRESGKPVTDETLFEIGSVSKTFTATLAAYAQASGRLSLSDSASKHLPALKGSAFDTVSLVTLGTHTPGGLPLQVPDAVTSTDELIAYFRTWKPAHAPGTQRTYANPSIGLLGMIAARSMDGDFETLMQDKVFRALGLNRTRITVPNSDLANYAQGYTTKGEPTRLKPGVLWREAYGVKSTAGDLARFVAANMGTLVADRTLQRAIMDTHTGYFRIGAMTQDLIWEQYAYPVDRADLLAGNSRKISLEANPAARIDPPQPPQTRVWINKTGSTNGFGAYVAYIPDRELGIVLLANKNYPIDARVTAAHQVLTRLDARPMH